MNGFAHHGASRQDYRNRSQREPESSSCERAKHQLWERYDCAYYSEDASQRQRSAKLTPTASRTISKDWKQWMGEDEKAERAAEESRRAEDRKAAEEQDAQTKLAAVAMRRAVQRGDQPNQRLRSRSSPRARSLLAASFSAEEHRPGHSWPEHRGGFAHGCACIVDAASV